MDNKEYMKRFENFGGIIIMGGTIYGAMRSGMFGYVNINKPVKIREGIWWDVCEFEDYRKIYYRPQVYNNECIAVDTITKSPKRDKILRKWS